MVNLLEVSPLTFDEYLAATDEALYAYYRSVKQGQQIEEIFHNRLLDAYRYYLIIGGMPECVENVIRCKNPRCITMTEHYVPQTFVLADREKATYRCEYCDAFYGAGNLE